MVIDKLYRNLPITGFELQQLEQYLIAETLDSKEKFIQEFGEQPLGTFVRKIVGLDQESIQQHFAEFIREANLSAKQIKFMDVLLRSLSKNGHLDPSELTSPPFTEQDDHGLIGLFDDNDSVRLIGLIREINRNTEVGA